MFRSNIATDAGAYWAKVRVRRSLRRSFSSAFLRAVISVATPTSQKEFGPVGVIVTLSFNQ
ncbi:MAG: hypothetical protein BWY82_00045 [Verrucomicrobia bacterium ADurb.Bin474]|nr:MAG: hypothetical protein BWY82_00045 [Verrucomicrobia bacterium ADurb.Bin474]